MTKKITFGKGDDILYLDIFGWEDEKCYIIIDWTNIWEEEWHITPANINTNWINIIFEWYITPANIIIVWINIFEKENDKYYGWKGEWYIISANIIINWIDLERMMIYYTCIYYY